MLILACLVQAADVTFTITLSDVGGNAQTLINDFADATGWKTTLPNGQPNPQTKSQWSKSKLQDHIKEVIKAYRANKKAEETLKKELTDSEAIIIFK